MSYLSELRDNFRVVDLLDILLVAIFIYFILLWLKTRASRAVSIAIVLVLCLYGISRQLDLYLTSSLFQVGLAFIVLSLVFVFQEDLRRAFQHIAGWERARFERQPGKFSPTIDVLVETASRLADAGSGALIVVRGREALEQCVRGGVSLGGLVSLPLLESIFDPHSPGHDGAAIIRGDRIEKFSVHLPLSVDERQLGPLGTRHAAALGLSERCDALVVVVSEERGAVGVARNGVLEILESASHLKGRLEEFYEYVFPTEPKPSIWRRSVRNLGTKLAAASAACLLWLLFAFRFERIERTYDVPIEYRNLPAQFELGENQPLDARVTLSGTERQFSKLQASSLRLSLDLSRAKAGILRIPLTGDSLTQAGGIEVTQVRPREARIELYRTAAVNLPVVPKFVGRLPGSLNLDESTVTPRTVQVVLRWMNSGPPSAILTEPIDLNEIRRTEAIRVRLSLPPGARLVRDATDTVLVHLRVTPEAPTEPEPAQKASPKS
jgi:uncharacterized protein (TIGR00159 family)